jgi:hypothetical protein
MDRCLDFGSDRRTRPDKTIVLPNEAETRRYVRQCLKKRENAPKRIEIDYKVIRTDGIRGEFIKPKSPYSSLPMVLHSNGGD